MRSLSIVLAGIAVFAAPVDAQQVTPAFEVATVRENTSSDTRQRIEVLPSGQFNAINMTLRELVSVSYPTDGGRIRHATQLVGGPGWIESVRFDIVAKAEGIRGLDTNRPGFTATPADREATERVRLMLQRLLAERFKLRVRSETRQMPIYHLVTVRTTGEVGPHLKKATTDCMGVWERQGKPEAKALACGSIRRTGPGRVTGDAAEMGPLADHLYTWTGRPVVDRTGYTGRFDFTLTWSADGSNDADAPSIFTAVQEQLGLKLEPAVGPVEVLVIDSVERPTPE